jgi:hypothetical protein
MPKHSLLLLPIALGLGSSAFAQSPSPSSSTFPSAALTTADYTDLVRRSLSGTNFSNLGTIDRDIDLTIPANPHTGRPAYSVSLKAGQSWSELPAGLAVGVGNLGSQTTESMAQQIYGANDPRAAQATEGSLANFKFLKKVSVKELVEAFPNLANTRLDANQVGSWGASCGTTGRGGYTFGSLANSSCGDSPLPDAVQSRIPMSQAGFDKISQAELAAKLPADVTVGELFLAPDITFDKVLIPEGATIEAANVMKFDIAETGIAAKGGAAIKGINSISGSNRVPNSQCINEQNVACDYAIVRSQFLGKASDKNIYNNNLAIQVNSPGTKWLDGGIGSLGTTIWNFKEPVGVSAPFSEDFLKVVLEGIDAKTGKVQHKAYMAFCVDIMIAPFVMEKNCSSKFIGPLPLPWPTATEKGNSMMFPMKFTAPTVTNGSSAVPDFSSISPTSLPSLPSVTSPSAPAIQGVTGTNTPGLYEGLFGSNTRGARSLVQNIINPAN